jgi:lambda family phage portal protein
MAGKRMRIPIISQIQDYRRASIDRVKAETQYFAERTESMKAMTKQAAQSVRAILDIASKPVMSLNEELYGGASGYSNPALYANHSQAKTLSRKALWESPAAQAMIGRFTDMVHGPALELQAMPIYELMPGFPADKTERQRYSRNIESRFRLWAKNVDSDYYLKNSHQKRSRANFEALLRDGEYIDILRYSYSWKKNPLSVQRISPDNLRRSGSNVSTGNTELDGIEYNAKTQAVAYHIFDPLTGKSTRVPKYGPKSGRQFVIHTTIGDGHRGQPLLAGVISELTKLSDFQALEIQAAVINALFAIWVETPLGAENKPIMTRAGINGVAQESKTFRDSFDIADYQAKLNSTAFSKGGIIAQNLGEGQKLNSFDTKRPTANFEQFFTAVKRNLYAAKGMSIAVADYNFNGSFSAARGELLVFWIRVMTLRYDHCNDYSNVIYRMWLWGEIDNGNIADYGWTTDPIIQDAMSYAHWTGPARPDIDPKKSAEAHQIESKNGWKTDNQITAERGGGDYDDNIERKALENDAKAAANESLAVQEKTTYSNSKAVSESISKVEGA